MISSATGQGRANPSLTFTTTEKQFLDSLKNKVTALFDNLDLSWDDIIARVELLDDSVLKKFGPYSLSHAFLIHKKGVLCYNKGSEGNINEFRKAIDFYKQAITLRQCFEKRYYKVVTPDIIYGYSNIGSCFWKVHDAFSTIDYELRALQIADKYPVPKVIQDIVLQSKILLARAYSEIGDYDNALQYYSSLANASSETPSDIPQGKADIWKLRALIELGGMQANQLENPEAAIANLVTAEKMLTSGQYARKEVLLADVYNNLGLAYRLAEDFSKSYQCYKKSIALNKKTNSTMDLTANYLNLGPLFNKMNMLDSAEFYLTKAAKSYSKRDKLILSLVYDNLGDVEFKKGNLEKSLAFDNLALEHIVPDFKPTSMLANPSLQYATILDEEGLLISLDSKATTLFTLFKLSNEVAYLESAYHTFLLADNVIGKIRSEFLEDASKIALVKKAKPVYEKAISTCYELYTLTNDELYINKAFELSEKSRSIILLDAARKTKANFNIAPSLEKEERQLKLKINYFEKQSLLQSAQEISITPNIRDSILLYRRQYAAILSRIKEAYPNYYHLAFEQPTISPKQVRRLLTKDQTLIEYFVGNNTLFVFTITKSSTNFTKINLDFPLHTYIKDFITHIYLQDNEFLQPAFKLYEHLVLPLTKKEKLKRKWIIVPDDALGSIPFDVLVTKYPTTQRIYFPSYKDYLIYNYQIGYAFSATTLQESLDREVSPEKSFLGVAPNLNESFSVNQTLFDKLDWNIEEIQRASSIFGGKCLYDHQITKSSFIERAPDYGIIHLATHAKANTENGDLSYIVFGTTPDNLLYAKDLYALNLQAQMVVLSACQTGAGSLSKGEGIISLARGFIYAGASSIITSLWNVHEEANKDIMQYFYQGVKDGKSKDEALHQAKLRFLRSVTLENQQTAHPFYWAPLVCMGDYRPYHIPSIFPWKLCILLIIILSIMIWVWHGKAGNANNFKKT